MKTKKIELENNPTWKISDEWRKEYYRVYGIKPILHQINSELYEIMIPPSYNGINYNRQEFIYSLKKLILMKGKRDKGNCLEGNWSRKKHKVVFSGQ